MREPARLRHYLKAVAEFQQEEAERRLRAMLEKQRLEGEAKLNAFVEAVAEGIVVVSQDGKIQIVNRRIQEMFGYTREELVGQGLDLLVPPRYRHTHAQQRKEYFSEPRIRAMGAGRDLTGCRKDDTEFPVEIGLSYVETQHGMLALGLVTDITERKRIESEIARINTELIRSNTELGQFAYVASHDLQEPLRMITGYLQLLERRYRDKLDAEALQFIQYAVEGAVRMKRLIEDLLALSRAGTQRANFRPVESQTLLQTACTNLGVAIEESRAEVTAGPLPPIVADPGLLTQVFQNLIGNAIKFRRKDRAPHIQVSAESSRDGHVFSISDDGIGIEARHLERIFGIFERLHGADQYEGSGVGLAITRRILERHGGGIWVESKPGEGSTFHFQIPAQPQGVDASRAASGKS
jgi:PAS domain S-box-containing protein